MPFDVAAHLRTNLALGEWNTVDLWLASYADGSDLTQRATADIVSGAHAPSGRDYDMLARTLNEHLAEAGHHSPVKAWGDLPGR